MTKHELYSKSKNVRNCITNGRPKQVFHFLQTFGKLTRSSKSDVIEKNLKKWSKKWSAFKKHKLGVGWGCYNFNNILRGGRNVKNQNIKRSEHQKSHKFDQNVGSQKDQNIESIFRMSKITLSKIKSKVSEC